MGGWYKGSINSRNGEIYKYEAKVYDEPSEYGIGNGKISKLYIYDKDGKVVANYDREWQKRPSGKVALIYKSVVNKHDPAALRKWYGKKSKRKTNTTPTIKNSWLSKMAKWF